MLCFCVFVCFCFCVFLRAIVFTCVYIVLTEEGKRHLTSSQGCVYVQRVREAVKTALRKSASSSSSASSIPVASTVNNGDGDGDGDGNDDVVVTGEAGASDCLPQSPQSPDSASPWPHKLRFVYLNSKQ